MEFTEEEVKEKLQELGYVNVPHSKLREFMTDLQELVEHDQSSGMYTTIDETDSDYLADFSSTQHNHLYKPKPLQDVSQRSQPVAFSKEKVRKTIHHPSLDKENIQMHNDTTNSEFLSSSTITSYSDSEFQESHTRRHQINPRRNQELQSANVQRKVARKKNGVSHVFDETLTDNDSFASDITIVEERLRNIPLDSKEYEFDDTSSDITSTTSRSYSHKWDERRTASTLPAFIRPSTAHPHTRKLRKSDPVARYHQFKEEWKVNKVPGESKRSSLRWNVREQMLNYDVFEKPRHQYTANNYVVPTEKKRQTLRWQVRTALAKS